MQLMQRRHPGLHVFLAVATCGTALGCRRNDPSPPATVRGLESVDSSSDSPGDRGTGDVAEPPPPRFTDITERVGLRHVHHPGPLADRYAPRIIGSGAAVFDYDGDGDLDIYLIDGGRLYDAPGADPAPNRLFRRGRDGLFTDVTAESGLGDTGYGMGCAVGDYDNDGHRDVYVTNFGADALYHNNGDGSFTEVTGAAGIVGDRWSCSAAFLDYDRDGFLDLYVTSYFAYNHRKVCTDPVGRPEFCGPEGFPGVADVLYHNEGGRRFVDVSRSAGITAAREAGLGVYPGDFDDDGWIDIYVANDADPNNLWINNKDGTFTDQAPIAGAAFNRAGQTEAGMGIAAGDPDDDGDVDLFVTHLRDETNTFYRNDGGLVFFDATDTVRLGNPSLTYTGFGTAFFDYDNDGDLDLAVVNGAVKRAVSRLADDQRGIQAGVTDAAAVLQRYVEPNHLYRNDGAARFVVAAHAGGFSSGREVSRGLIPADFDDDGGLDLVVTGVAAPVRLYRNNVPRDAHWLIVRAVDPALRRDALGARVTLNLGGRALHRDIQPAFSYLCSGDPRAHFGLGQTDALVSIDIRWPDGTTERFPPPPIDRAVLLLKGDGRPPS